MSVTLTVVSVIAFSFVAGEALRRLAEWRHIILSGAEYVLIGMILGPLALGLLSDEVMGVIKHGVWLLLGIVGFTLGLQLRALAGRGLKRGIVGLLVASLSIACVSGAVGGVMLLAGEGVPNDLPSFLIPVVILGAAGSVASARLHRSAVARLQATGPLVNSLEVIATVSKALAIVVAGIMLDWRRAIDSPALYDTLQLPNELWLTMGLIVGVVCGLLFVLFQRGEHDEERTFLATIGVVIFASGIAAALGSSPLLVGLVAGVTVSFASDSTELAGQLRSLEQPVSIALMLFAGAWFVPVGDVFLVLPIAYVLSRALCIVVLPRLFLTPILPSGLAAHAAGGLRSQGTIPVAIGVSMNLAYPEMAPMTDSILLGVLVFEVGAGGALRRTLGDAGELGRVPSAVEVNS